MLSKSLKRIQLFSLSMFLVSSSLLATETPVAGGQGNRPDDQKYAGLWVGSYTGERGDTGALSITLNKDNKGKWQGTVKYTNENGEQKADLLSHQIAGGKMKAKVEVADGAEATIEGQFQGDKLEGSYTISPKDSTEIADRGTWK